VKIELMQDQFQSIVEGSLDGIIVIQDGKPVYVNPAAVSIFGYDSADEMKSMNFFDLIAPASRPFVFHDPEGRPLGSALMRVEEIRGLTKHGATIDVEVNARVVEWNGRKAVQASMRDVSERKKLEREQARWLWEQEILTTIDRQLVAMVDLQKVLDAISQYAKALTRADFVGVVLLDLASDSFVWRAMKGNTAPVPSETFPLKDIHKTFIDSTRAVVITDFGSNAHYRKEDFPILTNEKLVSIASFPLDVENKREGFLIVGFRHAHQFSSRELRLLASLAEKSSIAIANANLYENLRKREKELEILTGVRVQAQEEERRRIARELHDGLGQMLTAIKFNLEIVGDSIDSTTHEYKRIEDMKELLDRVMKEAREISYDLMPSVLDDFGLVPALQLLCERMTKRINVAINFHTQGLTERLEPKMEVSLYRIAQEALNNVAKHAAATEVEVQIIRHRDGIRMTVEDNGKGMSSEWRSQKKDKLTGMGLVGIRERTASFNGKFTIDSSPGRGTVLTVDIPLTRPDDHGKDSSPSGG